MAYTRYLYFYLTKQNRYTCLNLNLKTILTVPYTYPYRLILLL